MTFKLVCWIFIISSLCISSLKGACDLKKFRENGIVLEIIPDVPQSVIKIQYPSRRAIDCGAVLFSNATKDEPRIEFKALNSDKLHTLVMFDPDIPTPQDPYLASYRHWLVENIPGSSFHEGYTISSYVSPNPPLTSNAHRYIFLIYQQPKDEKLENNFDNNKRTHFQINTFVQNRNLIGPIAGNFMYVRHS
ncbi:phosphatidylethanolamine-binding protein 1 [Trichonephila clavata]|uniref:Phosphatidylethanolamine-binding protein 1 n=1 Tax=Trichonephila clavata TaxID=2740835 RepID=A0A8X6LE40_TRICU|nr:phosphatidylethanolamine-binding protein 1 [Trichonephila clavata]